MTQRVVVVTGGAQGIGKAIAERFAQASAAVVIADLKAEGIGSSQTELLGLVCDVGDAKSANETAAAVLDRFGRIDVLVNNAGVIHAPLRFQNIAAHEIEKVMNVNVMGLFNMSRACLGALRDSNGSIVNVASNAGLRPRPFAAAYNASKAAVINLTQTLAGELAPDVRVNCVAPSVADTDMLTFLSGDDGDGSTRAALIDSIPMGRVATGADVAAAVHFLASTDASFITGVTLPVDGGRMVG